MFRSISITGRRIALALLAVASLSFLFPADAAARKRKGKVYDNILNFGSCGRHLFWKFEGGVLKIRGFGPMDNFASPSQATYSPFASQITQVILSDSVTSIGANAFAQCINLQSVNVPRYVYRVGKSAFANCIKLQSVDLPSYVDQIGDFAFMRCKSLTSAPIPPKVRKVGVSCFQGCASITDVSLPEGVTSVGDLSFAGCTSLRSISIPAKVKYFSHSALSDCPSIETVSVASGNQYYETRSGVLFTKGGLRLMLYPSMLQGDVYEIPAGTRQIAQGAFYSAQNLRELTIPEGVDSIGESAFTSCTGLQKLTIYEKLENLPRGVFKGSSNISEVYITSTGESFAIVGDAKLTIDRKTMLS
ncbi:MAG: leucine-rich repeat domain-containing protein, partial [Marinilabiliaceae bacterium]